ncbi:MAG: S4 domain-containing protein YaaA [Mycoplasmoidaceae bacterium]|nr:S4 domain-containing protein YaaA [Mycoplasmoidaceae bacterium]
MLNKTIFLRTEFITLAQLLKFGDVISSGGEAKEFLANNTVVINGVADNRRGRKLFVGDKVIINNDLCLTLTKK